MIPTAAAAKGQNDHLDLKRPPLLSHQIPDTTSRDPVMFKLQGANRAGSLNGQKEPALLATLSQFAGQMNVSAEQLLKAIEADVALTGGGSSGFETMAWDEFDTQGNDMMQKVYEDRLKKVQQADANNQLPGGGAGGGGRDAINPGLPTRPIGGVQINPRLHQQHQIGGQSKALPGGMTTLDIDSDDSDFGEQIAQKKKAAALAAKGPAGNNSSAAAIASKRMSTVHSRAIPIGGTLPPGMTILDLDSSDEDDFPPQRKGNSRAAPPQRGPASMSKGPKVISMSYKADHQTPLAQSMMGGGGMMNFGRGAFDSMGLDELQEEDEKEDSEEIDDDSDFGPLAKAQIIKTTQQPPALPQRPAVTPRAAPGIPKPQESPPPPPPLESPTNLSRPPRPSVTAMGAPQTTTAASRMSIWDKVKVGGAPGAGGAAATGAPATTTTGRMSIWDKAKTTTTAATATALPQQTAATTTVVPLAPGKIPATTTTSTTATLSTAGSTAPSSISNKSDIAPLSFAPVEIIPTSLPPSKTSSQLFQQLNDTGFLRNYARNKPEKNHGFGGNTALVLDGVSAGGGGKKPGATRVGPTKNIEIRFKFSTTPLTVCIHTNATVDEFIQESLSAYMQNNRTPQLKSMHARDYNLHMWDDDEEDVDSDIPPFNRSQNISQLENTTMCIVPGPDIGKKSMLNNDLFDEAVSHHPPPQRGTMDDFDDSFTGTGNNNNSNIEPNAIQREGSMLLDLNLNAAGALSAISAQFSEENLTTLDSVSAYIHQLYSVMTPASAGKPTQYKTFKINEKGKRQERYFGLDRYNIYNKTTPSSAFNTFSKLLNISKTERPIKSIIHVRVLPECLTTFEIDYKEDSSDTVTTRGYDVESVVICAEIVAKLRFLINNP